MKFILMEFPRTYGVLLVNTAPVREQQQGMCGEFGYVSIRTLDPTVNTVSTLYNPTPRFYHT